MPRQRDQELLRAVGARLATIRRDQGWSQEQLAEAIDIQPVSLSRLETGDRALSLTVLARAAGALSVPLGDLLDVDRPMPESPDDPGLAELTAMWSGMDEETRDTVMRVVREIARR